MDDTRPLADRYPEDRGIGNDPAVLFHADFERGQPDRGWDALTVRPDPGAQGLGSAVRWETSPRIARGRRSLQVQLQRDRVEDVTLLKWLRPGYDTLHMRYYVRYGSDYGYQGHGGGGFMADAEAGGFRGAGKAPDGDRHFWATLEPIGPRDRPPPGALIFYAYWWKMQPDGRGNYWGNWLRPDTDIILPLERWTCLEWRVQVNTPGQANGELDCWVNGTHCARFRRIEWRSSAQLRVNRVHLSLWLERDAWDRLGGGRTRTVWYDDLVVATRYIGPKRDRNP